MTSFGSKVALVLGGAGNIGSATIAALLELGEYKHVVMISRTQEKLDKAIAQIREKVGKSADKIVPLVGNISDEAEAVAVKKKMVAIVGDKIDHVISALGFSYLNNGPVVGVTFDQFKFVLNAQFYAPFGGYSTFMPLVKNSCCGSYIFVTGGGPDMYLGPGTGVVTIGGSANTALAKVALKEHAADDVCCTEISFSLGVTPDPSVMPPPFIWISSADAGRALAKVANSRQADGKSIVVRSEADIKQLIKTGVLEQA